MMDGILLRLGLIPYQEAKEIQLKALDLVKNSKTEMVLITLQHPPVYTIGKAGGFENILVSLEELKKIAEVYEVERGGNITFHGPGQIVAYPIINLNKWSKNVHKFVYSLEECIIRLLKDYGIEGSRKEKYPGVWVKDEKICALGVALKRWVTWHGIAFNVSTDLSYFSKITPCGIKEYGVTSLKKLGVDVDLREVEERLIEKFEEIFDADLREMTKSEFLEWSGQN
ncbi:lipoyl(octanoyl) transferase LipB [Thermoanaerobacter kivui]|uniref:lipoyl(octanoyl) transferase LipB n=1 Tax=Thermoanaerobacter kivui TaxID=2325 RepID=UPI0011DD95BC|nr:lipoyl(octanoyl) transferase LipB [Thermoanaerobacter kivui]